MMVQMNHTDDAMNSQVPIQLLVRATIKINIRFTQSMVACT